MVKPEGATNTKSPDRRLIFNELENISGII
jgi:hypothetical protein